MTDKNLIEEDAKLILDMYDYALSHDLDITSKSNVKQILENLGQKNIIDERVEALMNALAVTDHRIRRDIAKRKKVH